MSDGQQELFAPTKSWEKFPLLDASVRLQRAFLAQEAARGLFFLIRDNTPWQQDKIAMYGKTHAVPRLHRWYGDVEYSWSGVKMKPDAWTPLLLQLKREVEAASGATFNSALLNYYRTGEDMVGWHADDEPGVGEAIASVSLGTTRDFCMRHKRADLKVTIPLASGSLLVMSGATQKSWEHSLPRRKNTGPRINVTFRQMGEP